MDHRIDSLPLLPTTVVGSHPQPAWLIDREALGATVPRVRRSDLWRTAPEHFDEARRDAATLAIREMEAAGVDIVTDGEVGRESYSNHFLTAVDGVDIDRPAKLVTRAGQATTVPRVVGPIVLARGRGADIEFDDASHLVATTTRVPKVTLPGPFTLAQQCKDEYYGDLEALATDFAVAINQQARRLEATGVEVIQFDEPWYRNDPESAERFGVRVLDRALEGLQCRTVVHLCFGYAAVVPSDKPSAYPFLAQLNDSTVDEISIEAAQPRLDLGVLDDLSNKRIILGVIDLNDRASNTADVIAERAQAALRHIGPDRLTLGPDCGLKYLRRDEAGQLLRAMVEAAGRLRSTL
ncbi:MAG: 5-methyltetrahydropteroyltriglutamate--homocysteine methyltransferase [Actinomycetota bacterium]|nr:5-methyltetrahydropteroyltriglutamate--homocysteine methyltransferase [Actinomycetota bacterium]